MREVDRLDISDTEASLRAGLTPSYVREHYRFPDQHPRIDCVAALANVFGVRPEWLAWGVRPVARSEARAPASASPIAAGSPRQGQAARDRVLKEGMVAALRSVGQKRSDAEILVRGLFATAGGSPPPPAPRAG